MIRDYDHEFPEQRWGSLLTAGHILDTLRLDSELYRKNTQITITKKKAKPSTITAPGSNSVATFYNPIKANTYYKLCRDFYPNQ